MTTHPLAPIGVLAIGLVCLGLGLLGLVGACSDWLSNPYGQPSSTPGTPCDFSTDPPSPCLDCVKTYCGDTCAECTDTYRINCQQWAECWQGLHYCPTTYDLGSKAMQDCLSLNCSGDCIPWDGGA